MNLWLFSLQKNMHGGCKLIFKQQIIFNEDIFNKKAHYFNSMFPLKLQERNTTIRQQLAVSWRPLWISTLKEGDTLAEHKHINEREKKQQTQPTLQSNTAPVKIIFSLLKFS